MVEMAKKSRLGVILDVKITNCLMHIDIVNLNQEDIILEHFVREEAIPSMMPKRLQHFPVTITQTCVTGFPLAF